MGKHTFVRGGLLAVLMGALWFAQAGLAAIEVERVGDNVVITADGKPFATYVSESGGKPIVWPIVGPKGDEMTRAWPMRETSDKEEKDHVHHRSLWFTHGNVNGVDFWMEGKEAGRIVHRRYREVRGGPTGVIGADNDWVSPHGETICRDERLLQFHAEPGARVIDFHIQIFAGEKPVVFGDTKEGCLGIRVPETMRESAKLGGVIVDDSQKKGMAAVWGKPSKWIDYRGPVRGEEQGIAILDHPTSFRHPTRWHVRDYGLFAANPFGLRDFEGREDLDGSCTIPAGGSIQFRYRIIFHTKEMNHDMLYQLYNSYAAQTWELK